MRFLPATAAILLACPLAAQTYSDTFPYPDGPVPGWTTWAGSFAVRGGRLVNATGSATWSYITKDGYSATNCVLDGEFFFINAGIQFGGLTARHQGAGNTTLMCKIQNNGGPADFDRVFIYNRPGSSVYADIPGGTLSAFCRMIVLDGQSWMQIDANQDGIWEQTVGPLANTILTAGGVGMNVYSVSEMDNFEFFDGVLMASAGSAPRIGTTYMLDLDTPSPTTPWIGALSLGNGPIQLGDGRAVPLALDPLFTLTLSNAAALGMAGMTDAAGKANPSVPIPNNMVLVGLPVYAGAWTLDFTRNFGVGNITNDHYFVIEV